MRAAARRSSVLALAGALLAGCAACPPCAAPTPCPPSVAAAPPRPTPPPFDRERERRAVMRAVLLELYAKAGTKRFVLDRALRSGGPESEPLDDREIERLRAAGLRFEEPLRLSDGTRAFAPTIKGLDPRMVADWAAHAAPSPTPADLDVPLPIDWVTEADWDAVLVHVGADRIDLDESWNAFHRKHPDSMGWIHLSDVGFTPAGDAALTYAWSVAGDLDGAGLWISLEKHDGRWVIVKQGVDWVS